MQNSKYDEKYTNVYVYKNVHEVSLYKYRWQYNYVNLIPKGSFSLPNPLPLSLSLQGTGRGQSLAMRL